MHHDFYEKTTNTEDISMTVLKPGEKITLNSKEACSYLGINRNLLDSFRRAGLIRYLKAGRLFLYPVSELDAFVHRNIGKEITKEGLIVGEHL
jgi:excisionase family DNA binding protein